MSNNAKLVLVPLCGILVLMSLVVMTVFRRLISGSAEMNDEQLRRTKNFAVILLSIVIISLLAISAYLLIRFLGH